MSKGSIKSARPAAACCAGAETKVEKEEERPEEDASEEFAMRLAADASHDEEEKADGAPSLSKIVDDEAPSRRLERSAWPVSRARRRSIRREERGRASRRGKSVKKKTNK